MQKKSIKYISKISDIENNYKAFILDIWGVLWDGLEPYDSAVSSLKMLKEKNKPIILLSNAPRRAKTVEKRLEKIGIFSGLYNKIISSGEICRKNFLKNDYYLSKFGRIFYFIGQETDKDISANVKKLLETTDIYSANFLLVCGTRKFEDKLKIYQSELDLGLKLNLPLVCANPDRVVVRKSGEKLICAGELAHYYSLKGGKVFYYGKPYVDVYEECSKTFKVIDSAIEKKDILVIGDSLETDIKGANDYKLSSVLVTGGIHKDLFHKKVENISMKQTQLICNNYKQIPNFIINKFSF